MAKGGIPSSRRCVVQKVEHSLVLDLGVVVIGSNPIK
jgi:hypothetical protein